MTDISNGVLYAEAGSAAVYHCPADRSTILNSQARPRLRSYSVDGWLGSSSDLYDRDRDGLDPGWSTRLSQIANPADVFAFIDENEQSIDDGIFIIQSSSPWGVVDVSTWESLPSDRHRQGANVSFVDGHGEPHHWRAPKLFLARAAGSKNQDLQDLRWLQTKLPKP